MNENLGANSDYGQKCQTRVRVGLSWITVLRTTSQDRAGYFRYLQCNEPGARRFLVA